VSSHRSLAIRGGDKDLDIANGVIAEAAVDADATLDATNCLVVPGFVDVQINGGFGIDLTSEPERVGELAAALPQTGVTSFLPTIVSASRSATRRAMEVLAEARVGPEAARPLGAHAEGPFLQTLRRGAHDRTHLRAPTLEEAESWPGLAMVTVAPEVPGALDVIRALSARGIAVCVGHTAANSAELDAAFLAGARGATHLFNAMGPFGSRDPGTVGPLLAHPRAICGLIVDGVHVDPVMVTVAWRALGRDQVALVTDASAALGLGAGIYQLGATDIVVDDRSVRTADGVLAGSVLAMDEAVRNLITFTGCSLADAARAASTTPARLLRRPDLGSLGPGCAGDVVLIEPEGRVAATVIAGRVAFDRDDRLGRRRGCGS
jgi:N-acetylglucosamine-6-phosphate deacetylase